MNTKFTLKLLSLILIVSILAGSLFSCIDIINPNGSESTSSTTTTLGGSSSTTGSGSSSNTTTKKPDSSSTTTTKPSSSSGTTTGGSGSDDPALDHVHADSDDNGFCDSEKCGIDVVETIDFYNFNDLHGKFLSTSSSQPGVGAITSYLESKKETDEHVIITSTGDMWQGSGESYTTRGAIVTEWMNYLDFEAMAIGNHEYDWGEKYIISNNQLAEFPFLAINIFDNRTNERVDYCEASVMIERGGAQIGIIGAIGDCYSSILADMTKNVKFLVGSQLTDLVEAECEKLRDAGADVIIYLIHEGTSYNTTSQYTTYYDPSLSRPGYVDVVFEGHSHSYYTFTDSYGTPHVQGGGDNQYGRISHVELNVNFANGNITYNAVETVSNYTGYAESDIIEDLKATYSQELEKAFEELGYNARYRSSDTIADVVAQLYYEAGREKWKGKYDVVLAGGQINTRSPYNINAGTVTFSDLLTILPFDNKLMLCAIKGSDLISRFFNNSSYVYYSELTSSQINKSATYYIIVDTWSSGYYKNNLTVIEEYDDITFAHDLLAQYIREGNWSK